MKKRPFHKKLRLRKETLRTLEQNAMGNVAGGVTILCGGTQDEFCIATTLAPNCAEEPPAATNTTIFTQQDPCTFNP